ncbi:DUF6461 domain-containing protein (plasmid) [Embleya sp. NBC_00888]|uniref:DUF6461 domain-containing protein n=1 Tax=Embleya sp. NBC_00888 TaxID=2975960 RepID=UPI002F915A6B|nr:DUF6461 domain-containing protein [Embleya sp. NBC_00888]
MIRAGTCGKWAWAHEESTSRSADPEVTRAVSAGTLALSLYHDLRSMTALTCAENGTLVTAINTWRRPPPSGHAGSRPAMFDADVTALGADPHAPTVGTTDPVELFFGLAETRFGVGLTHGALLLEPVWCGAVTPDGSPS